MTTSDFGDQMHAVFDAWVDTQKELGELWLRALGPRPDRARPHGEESHDPFAAGAARHDAGGTNGTAAHEHSFSRWPADQLSAGTEVLLAGYRAAVRMWQVALDSFLSPGATPGAAPAAPPGSPAGGRATAPWTDAASMFSPWARTPFDVSGFSRVWLDGFQSLYRDGFQRLAEPWLDALRPPDEGLSMSDGHRSALSEFTDLYWDGYERTMVVCCKARAWVTGVSSTSGCWKRREHGPRIPISELAMPRSYPQ